MVAFNNSERHVIVAVYVHGLRWTSRSTLVEGTEGLEHGGGGGGRTPAVVRRTITNIYRLRTSAAAARPACPGAPYTPRPAPHTVMYI
ncbi:hypothetical protein EVAR_33792_1 [Eumeta japonica]|uniref:Uncharacterized protein n=1 Tax=Eumeta variegata TaxID=151549 RepID=A0A4C1VSA5_EUMVA|nr:hypothetical protein EVAR_33792_1 [Eumeta japonica]